MSGDIFGCPNWRMLLTCMLNKGTGTSKYSTMLRTVATSALSTHLVGLNITGTKIEKFWSKYPQEW